MKAPGTDKSRVVRLPKKLRFVVRSFAFFFFLSLFLSLSFQTNARHDLTAIRAAGLIGELANYCVKRSGICARITRSLVHNELIKRPR